RKQFGPFELLTAMAPGATHCDLAEQIGIRLDCASVEQTFLVTFGIQPVLGRNFLPDEDRPNVPRVALLGYSLWKSRFGGSRNSWQNNLARWQGHARRWCSSFELRNA